MTMTSITHPPVRRALCCLALLSASSMLFACLSSAEGGIVDSAFVSGTGETSGATASASGDGGEDSDSDEDSDTEPKLDQMDEDPDGIPLEMGCEKVDILFVIDNSSSMAEEQAALISSFPGFVAGMQDELTKVDSYHVGVVTTDTFSHQPPTCERLGTLITQTLGAGVDSSDAECGPYLSGKRFMTEADDLESKFGCAAKVGTEGSLQESQIAAGIAAIEPSNNIEGACNEGFSREDALLILVLITDETEHSPGHPGEWFDAIVEAKAGVESNVVVLAIIKADSPDHYLFTDLFTNGHVGNIAAPSYDAFFSGVLADVEGACSEFTPPE